MKQGDRVYVLVSTWGCYSDYVEKVLYVTDDRQDAINSAKTASISLNAKAIASQMVNGFSTYDIDEDTTIVLRDYPFKTNVDDLTKAERTAYHIDEDTLYAAKKVSGGIDGHHIACYLLKSATSKDGNQR